MNPTITPTDATLGAIVTDVNLADLLEAEWNTVEEAFHEFGVLIIPLQHLDAEVQVDFSRRFGDLEFSSKDQPYRAVTISNQGADGKAAEPSRHQRRFYAETRGGILIARICPCRRKHRVFQLFGFRLEAVKLDGRTCEPGTMHYRMK